MDYSKISFKNGLICSDYEQLNKMYELSQQIQIYEDLVDKSSDELKKLEQEIEKCSMEYNDLELKVFHLHIIKNLRLNEVAKITNYSYDRIKQISSKIKNNTG